MIARRRNNYSQWLISRWPVAAAIMVVLVAVCIFLVLLSFPAFLSRAPDLFLSNTNHEVRNSTSCESKGNADHSQLDSSGLLGRIIELRMQVHELKRKLFLAEQEKNNTNIAGPFGTVKALPNPTIVPNQTLNPRLADILAQVAVGKELVIALANTHVKPLLEIWFSSIKKVGIPNYLVMALDDETLDFCRSNNVPVYKRDPDEAIESIGRSSDGGVVSGLKFRVLREFLQMGYSVLVSDVDVIFLQNPFDHLYRDSDVESMTDGHDNRTAYGCSCFSDDPVMGWAYNSGFFYIRPTVAAIELLDRVCVRLAREKAWDQVVFNEELFFPSRPGYGGLLAAKRTMDFNLFMDSKVLFKTVRNDENVRKLRPVVVHVNYHPDKLPRMRAVFEFYLNGKVDALDPFPVGTPRVP